MVSGRIIASTYETVLVLLYEKNVFMNSIISIYLRNSPWTLLPSSINSGIELTGGKPIVKCRFIECLQLGVCMNLCSHSVVCTYMSICCIMLFMHHHYATSVHRNDSLDCVHISNKKHSGPVPNITRPVQGCSVIGLYSNAVVLVLNCYC